MLEKLLSEQLSIHSLDYMSIKLQDQGQETDENQSDNDEPYLPNLERMKNFLITSPAFKHFRASLRESVWENPAIATNMKEPILKEQIPSISNNLIDHRISKRLKIIMRKITRPPDCGDVLYADFNANSIKTISSMEIMLNKYQVTSFPQSNVAPQHQTIDIYETSQPETEIGTNYSQRHANNQQRASNSTQSIIPKVTPSSSSTITNTGQSPIYFELCVNSGQRVKSLGEIDVGAVKTDGDFFAVVKEHYLRLRSFRSRFWLLRPSTISYVRFSVEDRCRVGILHKPVALPPKSEVDAKRYTYEPCPLENELPIDPDLFIHYLFNCSSPSKRRAWLPRIPRKLDTSIFAAIEPAGFGWGIYIDEGPDYFRIFLLNLGILFISGIAALIWMVLKHDFQGAFGFACWIIALLNTLMAVFIAKWKQD